MPWNTVKFTPANIKCCGYDKQPREKRANNQTRCLFCGQVFDAEGYPIDVPMCCGVPGAK